MKKQTRVNLGNYKSLNLPVLFYCFSCVFASRADLRLLKKSPEKCSDMDNRE